MTDAASAPADPDAAPAPGPEASLAKPRAGSTESRPAPLRLNLRDARVLCADENSQGIEIVSQILMGFGVNSIARASTAAEYRQAFSEKRFDLVLLDARLGGNGFAENRWLRTSGPEPNRFCPVVVLAGHTPQAQVEEARDCGANFVIAKPLSASVLLQRLVWIARSGRLFVEGDTYAGPDRRFHHQGVPGGIPGRRNDDLSGQLGDAIDPNMSQDEIDRLLKPQRMSL